MELFYFLIISFALIFGIEILKKKLNLSSDITRRLIHIGSTAIAFFAPLFLDKYTIFLSCMFFACAMFFLRKKHALGSIHNVKRKTYGDIFLPIGEGIIALLFLPNNILAFQYGIVILGISDSLAGLCGDYFVKQENKILKGKKSIKGSMVFLLSSLCITYLFTYSISWYILLVCISLTVIEMLSDKGIDNLLLPIAASSLFLYIM